MSRSKSRMLFARFAWYWPISKSLRMTTATLEKRGNEAHDKHERNSERMLNDYERSSLDDKHDSDSGWRRYEWYDADHEASSSLRENTGGVVLRAQHTGTSICFESLDILGMFSMHMDFKLLTSPIFHFSSLGFPSRRTSPRLNMLSILSSCTFIVQFEGTRLDTKPVVTFSLHLPSPLTNVAKLSKSPQVHN